MIQLNVLTFVFGSFFVRVQRVVKKFFEIIGLVERVFDYTFFKRCKKLFTILVSFLFDLGVILKMAKILSPTLNNLLIFGLEIGK